MDPAVLGTLRIGLDAIHDEAQPRRPRRSANGRQTARPLLRPALAALLRRAAELLEPRHGGEAAPEV